MSNPTSTTTFRLEDFFSPSMIKMINVQDRFEKKLKSVQGSADKSFSGIKNRLNDFQLKHSAVIGDITAELPMLGRGLQLISNPYVLAGAAAVGAAAGIAKATSMANTWQLGMNKVNVTLQETPENLKKISDQLIDIGKRNEAPLEQIPDAFNRIVSAGLDAETSLRTLEPVLKAVKGGFSDIGVVAPAAVAVMNSSGIMDATKVLDILFAVLNKGNAEFNDVAQYLPKIIPSARDAGFELYEVGGAWAYLTAQGQTAERATTLLENAFKALKNPDRINSFNKLGVAIFDTTGKMLPMTKIVDQLSGKLAGLTDKQRIEKLASLGLDMEAASAFSTMSQNVDKLTSSVDFAKNSTGQLDLAAKNASGPLAAWDRITNKFKAGMIKLGEIFLPIVEKMVNKVEQVWNYIENAYHSSQLFRDMISGVGVVFKVAFNIASFWLQRAWNIAKALWNVVAKVGEAAGLGGGGFQKMYEKARPYLVWTYNLVSKIAEIGYKLASMDFSGAWESIKNFNLPSIKEISEEQKKEIEKNQEKINKATNKSTSTNPDAPVDPTKTASGTPSFTPVESATSGKTGSRNNTTNIKSMVENMVINISKAGVQEYSVIREIIKEELVKAVRDSEFALSSDY